MPVQDYCFKWYEKLDHVSKNTALITGFILRMSFTLLVDSAQTPSAKLSRNLLSTELFFERVYCISNVELCYPFFEVFSRLSVPLPRRVR